MGQLYWFLMALYQPGFVIIINKCALRQRGGFDNLIEMTIRQLNLADPGDLKLIEAIRRNKSPVKQRLYLVDDRQPQSPPRGGQLIAEDVLQPQSSSHKTWNHILRLTLKKESRLIHFQPRSNGVFVAIRCQGQLQKLGYLQPAVYDDLVAYLKASWGLTLDSPVGQATNGRFKMGRQLIKAQAISQPTLNGQKLTIKLALVKNQQINTLSDLGFWGQSLASLNQALGQSSGLVVILSPQASSRQLLLSSCLQVLAKTNQLSLGAVLGLPLPLEDLNQIIIDPNDPSSQLRASRLLANSDHDVIAIEDANQTKLIKLALTSALNNKLVLITVGAESIPALIDRLLAIDIASWQLLAAQPTFVNWHQVRRLNKKLTWSDQISDRLITNLWQLAISKTSDINQLGQLVNQAALSFSRRSFKPNGPLKLPVIDDQKAYQGQIGVGETLTIRPAWSAYLTSPGFSTGLYRKALSTDFVGLAVDGLIKILLGLTSYDELKNNLQ